MTLGTACSALAEIGCNEEQTCFVPVCNFQQTEKTISHTTWPVSHMLFEHIMFERGEKKQKTNPSWGLVSKAGQQQLTLGLFSSQT